MKPRFRVIVSVISLLVAAWLSLYGVAAILVRPHLAELEKASIQDATSHTLEVISNDLNRLRTSTLDWASWDDTYEFVSNRNQDYIAANMTNGSLKNIEVNFVVMTNAQGKVVYSKGITQPDGDDLDVPGDILEVFSGKGEFLARDEKASHHGILVLKSGAVLFSSAPILNSHGEGPVRGTFVFVQNLDQSRLDRLTGHTELPIRLYAMSDPDLPPDVRAIAGSVTTDVPITRTLSDRLAVGYQLLDDAHGKPALIARVEVSRSLSYETSLALNYYLLVSGLVAFLLALMNGRTSRYLIQKQEAVNVKDEFISMASHELRTPLAAIKGNSRLARQMYGKNNPELTEMLDDIYASSERLIRIVTNFLDAARLEQGKLPLRAENIDAVAVMYEVADELQSLAAEKGIYIKADVPDRLPDVYADRDRLKQIVYNLVGNAIKFTETGGITLTAKAEAGQMIVSVGDTGRGIPRRNQQTLFARFGQVKRTDAAAGSGLGLHISKLLVENMNGKIWLASSKPDKGTVISFSLPLAERSQNNA